MNKTNDFASMLSKLSNITGSEDMMKFDNKSEAIVRDLMKSFKKDPKKV